MERVSFTSIVQSGHRPINKHQSVLEDKSNWFGILELSFFRLVKEGRRRSKLTKSYGSIIILMEWTRKCTRNCVIRNDGLFLGFTTTTKMCARANSLLRIEWMWAMFHLGGIIMEHVSCEHDCLTRKSSSPSLTFEPANSQFECFHFHLAQYSFEIYWPTIRFGKKEIEWIWIGHYVTHYLLILKH